MKTCCVNNPYKSKLCRSCWRASKENEYHCTWPRCIRPVFALTLCRTHYRQINVQCAWPECQRPSYCKQVCAHHYRKRQFPQTITCNECEKPVYMHQKCFYHFTHRTCIKCARDVFSKQLCQRHYMREYRRHRSTNNGCSTSNENNEAAETIVPDTTNHNPVSQSSFEHSVIA